MVFLYMSSLISRNSELIDKVFLDYLLPKMTGSRDKLDIYIDEDPGYYIEVKYIRHIPSRKNIPLPQHRGSLINDMIKLVYKTPAKANKYLLLVTTNEFFTHILNKPRFPLDKESWHGRIRDLITTDTEENRLSGENKKYLDKEAGLQLLKYEIVKHRTTNLRFHIILWKVIIP